MIPHNRYNSHPDDEGSALRVLRSGCVGQGPEVRELEQEIARRFPGRDCAVVSSGSAALCLAVSVLGGEPDEGEYIDVRYPDYACSAIGQAVHMAGASAVLVDVDPTTLNRFDQSSRGVEIFVHTYGVPAPIPRGKVIEDITHAIGAGVGREGAMAVCSMGPTKLLSSPGGGFVLGRRDAIREVRDRRDYDGQWRGFNFQMSDVHAAVARQRLRRLDDCLAERADTAALYDLARPRAIRFQAEDIGFPEMHPCDRSWYRYVIFVEDWRKAQSHFAGRGVETINPLEPRELPHWRAFGEGSDAKFPGATYAAEHTLSLPIWPGMGKDSVRIVADALSDLEP